MTAELLYILLNYKTHSFIDGDYPYKNYFFNIRCEKCGCYGRLYQKFTSKVIYVEYGYDSLSCEECIIKNVIE